MLQTYTNNIKYVRKLPLL